MIQHRSDEISKKENELYGQTDQVTGIAIIIQNETNCLYFASNIMSFHHIKVDGGDTVEWDIFEIFPSAMT